jgi:hypothetical protein
MGLCADGCGRVERGEDAGMCGGKQGKRVGL